MRRIIRTVSACAAVLVIAAGTAAQHQHGTEALGKVHFETTCQPAVQAGFDRAVALLHSFEFHSAIAAFNDVLRGDPSCAMAYWGIALSSWANPFAGLKGPAVLEPGRTAAQKAQTTGSPSPREKRYIDAVAELFRDFEKVPQRERTLAYEKAMEGTSTEFGADTEARIFYALAVAQNALPTDKTYANQLKATSILEPLFSEHPDHPGLAHYIIHAYDQPALAARALNAARSYATIAPDAPHALHMPSHTFTRVGAWSDSIKTNAASADAAVKTGSYAEALHAMDYMTYAYLQTAQDAAARRIIARLPETAKNFDPTRNIGAAPGWAGIVRAGDNTGALRAGARRLGGGSRARGANDAVSVGDAQSRFARALGAARSDARMPHVRTSSSWRRYAKSSPPPTMRIGRVRQTFSGGVAEAWVAYASGRRDDAIAQLGAAADARTRQTSRQ
jgi:hypothetical protein